MNILCIFSGQGYRNNTLFDFFEGNKTAQTHLNQYSLENSCRLENPNDAQLIIGAYQLTLFNLIKPLLINHQVTLAGYSLGEVNACLASIEASPEEVNTVLKSRTQLMTALLKSGNEYDLLFIRGHFQIEDIKTLCASHHCAIAIINSNERLIIGGSIGDLNNLLSILPAHHLIHSQFLGVHLPSHTFFYENQKGIFQNHLNTLGSRTLHYPILSPLELCKIYEFEQEKQLLDKELYTTLQWYKLCALISEYHYDLILDLGPGDSMTKQLEAVTPDISVVTLSYYANVSSALRFLKNQLSRSFS